MSRELYPKQLLPLVGETSLLQQTGWRVHGATYAKPVVVCGEEHRFVIAEQLRAIGVPPQALVLEPVARNTAPAIATAALLLSRTDPGTLMLVCPADHAIGDLDTFEAAVATAASVARAGYLVTFGVAPTAAETGYGYVHAGTPIGGRTDAFEVDRFVEKPAADVARRLAHDPEWSWNSGMFVFTAQKFLDELARFAPDVLAAARAALEAARPDLDFLRLGAAELSGSPAISVDHAVMERTQCAAVVRADFAWTDVGSWSALWRMGEPDQAGNVLLGDVEAVDSSDCYLRADDGVMVATLGLRDTVVVATSDAVLVADRSRDQQVKLIVDRLKGAGRSEASAHQVVYRPWGSYKAVDAGPGYQVKHITVKPGHKLSLQTHQHRAEHWVVVSGTAEVVRGDDKLVLRDRMSIDVPVGCVHRLGNPGPELLHLIEVQAGNYLGEDDIVRLEDSYGRDMADAEPVGDS
jgi:mannose-1-phosphate guanylyltransferase/mannose-1-phosphate guanylyltransferase/mannose-6-phosphate isomerase